MKAYMYNKHAPLCVVEIEGGKITKIYEVIEKNRHLMPVSLTEKHELSLESINIWLDKRKIPDGREGIKDARMKFRGFDTQKNMFGLSDQYWFQYKKTENWDRLNFFTNRYEQEMGLIFFEPWRANMEKVLNCQSPDITTGGVLRKRWIQDEEGNSFLLKAGSALYKQEPLSEVLASITLRKINIIPFVEYELIIYGLQFCSKCPNFVTANTEFVPASHIYNKKPRPNKGTNKRTVFEHFIDMCNEYNIVGAEDYLTRMVAVDHILCNTDRHLSNFGFIRDVETGKIMGFSPLFDFGRAYFGKFDAEMELSSKFFSDKEKACFKKIVKQLDVDTLTDTNDMEEMVKQYPELPEKQTESIIKRIHIINREMMEDRIPKKSKGTPTLD